MVAASPAPPPPPLSPERELEAALRSAAAEASAADGGGGGGGGGGGVGQTALLGLGLGLGVGVAALFPFVSIPLTKSLPYMHTPRHRLRQGFAGLRPLLRKRPRSGEGAAPPAFVDLGSGDGTAVIEAVKGGTFGRAVGVELNWGLVAYSWFAAWREGVLRGGAGSGAGGAGGGVAFHKRDLWTLDLGEFDAVMMFGVKPLMAPLAAKVRRECRPGTVVMLYRFKLPDDALGGAAAKDARGGDAEGDGDDDGARVIVPSKVEGEFSYYTLR
eukprot:CAMPEP_0118853660 /NCGR_PEP_ID=MMETSP1163-20130328/2129_1 /TAXON_ID=124430 /ORGANISM="Phaeomonas parva, Strain CCMP2877" /LENGTH=270 /DNA_ID=CAMNT_0006786247 /DNA_START=819 /DNA_END=1631 /DNA_ORIENTATION=-